VIVVLFGATGLVGRALALRLRRDRHVVRAWVRDPVRARGLLGAEVEQIAASDDDGALVELLDGCDAIVNVAGEPVAQRWSSRVRSRLVDSRVGLNDRITAALVRCARRPKVWVQASAVGYYGDRGDELVDETAVPGTGFLADLCRSWEASALAASPLGVRVVCLRIGLVLAGDGGVLPTMAAPARWGLGAVLGDGRQHVPWIHLVDLVELFVAALADDRYAGAINAVAPAPVTHRSFVDAISRTLRRPRVARVPGLALRLALGEAAVVVLGGQRVMPMRACELGLRFEFPTLETALNDLLGSASAPSIVAVESWPASAYLDRRRPSFCLESRVSLTSPLAEVMSFFAKAENLGAMTPAHMAFGILGEAPQEIHEGSTIDYEIQLGVVPLRWRTRIERVDAAGFVDCQLRGPYRCWYHEHRFERSTRGTEMIDRVWYAPPLGALGRIAQWLVVAGQLRRIFAHRRRCAQLRFGDAARAPTTNR